jgi:hypothetical protein
MSKITPEQIDRGLSIAETVVNLASDVWNHRKQRTKTRVKALPKARAKKKPQQP